MYKKIKKKLTHTKLSLNQSNIFLYFVFTFSENNTSEKKNSCCHYAKKKLWWMDTAWHQGWHFVYDLQVVKKSLYSRLFLASIALYNKCDWAMRNVSILLVTIIVNFPNFSKNSHKIFLFTHIPILEF